MTAMAWVRWSGLLLAAVAFAQTGQDFESWVQKGRSEAAAGRFDVAILDFTEAIRLRPDDGLTYSLRANMYLAANRRDEGMEDLTHAMQLAPARSPRMIELLMARALVYLGDRQYYRAIEDYSAVIQINRDARSAYMGRASAKEGAGDAAGAKGDRDLASGMGLSVGGVPDPTSRSAIGVTPPVLVHKVEPEYSEKARKARVDGTVTLSMKIAPDGSPTDITVAKALGYGLDEKAIEAVKKWRFQPGMKDGKPVPVIVSVEVSFHLHTR